jgi:uncharacterized membrane protein
MASLIVLAPVCLALMRLIRRDIAGDPSRGEIWVRRWALFLTLFAAGATIVVDLIVLITTFLNGEALTAAFLLKVVVVLLVAAAGFMHFMADLWGYWNKNPRYAHSITWAVALLVVLTILAGFFIIGTPMQARQARLDDQRISDLQNIQSQVVNYWQAKQKLPGSLADLNDTLSYFTVPQDPAGGQYEYVPGEGNSFKLCATFAADSVVGNSARISMPIPYGAKGVADNWSHGAGHQCFERTIDPAFYPPLKK